MSNELEKITPVTGVSVHAHIQRNSTYIHMVKRYIYDTRRPENPHLPICWYQQRSQVTVSRPH